MAIRYSYLPQNLTLTPFATTEDFEVVGEWSVAVGTPTIVEDVVTYHTGTKAVQVNTLSAGQNSIQKTVSLNLSASHDQIQFWVYSTVACPADTVTVYLSANAGFTKYFQRSWSAGLVAGWNHLTAITSDWTVAGGMTWADTVVRLRVRFGNNHALNPTLTYDSFLTGGVTLPAVLFELDDAKESTHSYAYPHLLARNCRASSWVISDVIGTADYMDAAELLVLDGADWTVGNHTASHPHLNTLSLAGQQAELSNCDTVLAGIGINATRRKHVAYPFGDWNADTLTAMTNLGMLTGRPIVSANVPLMPWVDSFLLNTK